MGEAMLRTAYSQILNSSRDFSTALCDAQARLIAQAEHVPIHVGAIPWAVESVRDAFKGRVRPGDVYLLNDHYQRAPPARLHGRPPGDDRLGARRRAAPARAHP